MATYPALVQLIRMLGRTDALAALGVNTEPDPATLSEAQRERLWALIDVQLENVAAELVEEAAASDDVSDRRTALAFTGDRIAEFGELVTPDQAGRLLELVAAAAADWG